MRQKALISSAIEQLGHTKSGAGHWGVVAEHELYWYVAPELARMKYPSFRDEREWRLIYPSVWSRTYHVSGGADRRRSLHRTAIARRSD
jgi:hypothetical protein